MRFGTPSSEDVKIGGESGSAGGRWIRGWKKGDTEVRFLDERDEWTVYWEHWNIAKQRYFPCTRDRSSCPGCTSEIEREQSASKRYLTNALVGDYVDVVKIPASIIEKIDRYYTKDNGSILKRPYTIIRTGEGGTDTSYDVDYEDRSVLDVDDYRDKMQDHEDMLRAAYVEAWGTMPDEQDSQEAEKPKRAPRKAPAKAEPEKKEPIFSDNPPSEPQSESDAAEGDEEILSEETIRQMSAEELLDLYKRAGILAPVVADNERGRKKLADNLINELGE